MYAIVRTYETSDTLEKEEVYSSSHCERYIVSRPVQFIVMAPNGHILHTYCVFARDFTKLQFIVMAPNGHILHTYCVFARDFTKLLMASNGHILQPPNHIGSICSNVPGEHIYHILM